MIQGKQDDVKDMPTLTIQIVGWNSADDLRQSLKYLQAPTQAGVTVRYIDNASADDSIAVVQELLPQADIITSNTNLGFSGGHNRGLAKCTSDFVLLHNPDLQLDWAGIQELLKTFDDTKVAAVQGNLYRDQERTIFDSCGIEQTLTLNGRDRGAGQKDTGQYENSTDLFAVTGACALYRVTALHAIAHSQEEILDDDMFAYKDDVDLGWRLNKAGWRVRYEPVVAGVHGRAVRSEGFLNWGLNPIHIYKRLQSTRTRWSLRNWLWMITKNASLKQLLLHGMFIDLRWLTFFLLSFTYPPLLTVWPEIIRGLPRMLEKRTLPKANKANPPAGGPRN